MSQDNLMLAAVKQQSNISFFKIKPLRSIEIIHVSEIRVLVKFSDNDLHLWGITQYLGQVLKHNVEMETHTLTALSSLTHIHKKMNQLSLEKRESFIQKHITLFQHVVFMSKFLTKRTKTRQKLTFKSLSYNETEIKFSVLISLKSEVRFHLVAER